MHYVISARAAAELRDQLSYIRAENPSAAEKIAARLEELLDLLCFSPTLGIRSKGDTSYRLPVRPFPYLIFYLIDGDQINVLSIFHTSRNPDARP